MTLITAYILGLATGTLLALNPLVLVMVFCVKEWRA